MTARHELEDGEKILSVQGWMNFQRIADMAFTGVKSTTVKGDHLCYHSAQKKGSSDFVEFHESDRGSRCLCSLISFQDYSISSFLSNLYKYFTKQWRNHHDLGETYIVSELRGFYCVIDLWWIHLEFKFCNSSTVCVERGIGGPPLLSLHTLTLPVNAIWIIAAIWIDANGLNRASSMFNFCRIQFCYCRTN